MLDQEALRWALENTLQRHSVLRASFPISGDRPVQFIHPDFELPLPIEDFRRLPALSRQEALEARLAALVAEPFDLAVGPLVRASLFRLSDSEHVLLLLFHHAVFDGWSEAPLMEELALLYDARLEGRAPNLPDLPLQYADFALWQRQSVTAEKGASQLDYWLEQLRQPPAALELPADHPRPPHQTASGASQVLRIPPAEAEALKALARAHNATLFMVLLSAFYTLLYRYTLQEDILIGVPVAGRGRTEFEPLIGNFTNTLALRARLSAGLPFSQLLALLRRVSLEAFTHQGLPFELLVEKLNPERDLNRPPLFQVMFQLRNYPRARGASAHLEIARLPLPASAVGLDLELEVVEAEGGLTCELVYNREIFDQDRIARTLGHYQVLLSGILANPETPLARLPILAEAERRQLLYDFNQTEDGTPTDSLLHGLFEAQVSRTPEAIALIAGDRTMSYRELDRRANQLSHLLRARGVGPEVIVAIMMERSFEMIVALLAVLKAGGAYLPIDPDLPEERIGFMLVDAGLSLLLTQPHLQDRLPGSSVEILTLDSSWNAIDAQPTGQPPSSLTAENAAAVIYTSGSTGVPKGVVLLHGGLSHRFLWSQRVFPLDDTDRMLQHSSFSFDFSIWEIFIALGAGAGLVLARQENPADTAYFSETVANHKVTIIGILPFLLQIFLEDGNPQKLASLRHVSAGGDELTQRVRDLCLDRTPAELVNMYGPTEVSIDATWWACKRDGDDPIPVGHPNPNTKIYVLDSELQPVPIGVRGEIYISGAGLARGYLNRPELTAEHFIPNPFEIEPPYDRMYRTGDLAYYRPDGALVFVGRIDHQVKIRGNRVELGEVEAALSAHPALRQAAVLAPLDEAHSKYLAAYLQLHEGEQISTSELGDFLRQRLPLYMLPSAYVFLDEFPLLPNGKLDRDALPKPDAAHRGHPQMYLAPRTEVERILADIWCAVLDLEKVGVLDDFFALGGHSLLAARILARLYASISVDLPLRSLFEGPTIAQQAALVEEIILAAAD